jgi:hypothetical protein
MIDRVAQREYNQCVVPSAHRARPAFSGATCRHLAQVEQLSEQTRRAASTVLGRLIPLILQIWYDSPNWR